MHYLITALLVSLLFFTDRSYGQEADPILGLWNTPQDQSEIEIFKCGMEYCGRIAALKEPTYPLDDHRGMGGQPKMDRNNPDPALRTRPMLGLKILEGFSKTKENVWQGGTIYNPDNGKIYQARLTLSMPNRLNVRGFIGISLIGGTSIWTRATLAQPR